MLPYTPPPAISATTQTQIVTQTASHHGGPRAPILQRLSTISHHTPGQSSPNSTRSYSIIAITIGYNLGANGNGIISYRAYDCRGSKSNDNGNTNDCNGIILWCEWLRRPAACKLLLESIINDIFASITKAVCAISTYVTAERRQMGKVPPQLYLLNKLVRYSTLPVRFKCHARSAAFPSLDNQIYLVLLDFFTDSTWRNPSVCSSLAELGMSSSHLSIAQNSTTLRIIPHTTIINPTWRRQLSHPEYMFVLNESFAEMRSLENVTIAIGVGHSGGSH